MCNYSKKYKTSSKLAIDRIKELEQECARLAAGECEGCEHMRQAIDDEIEKREFVISSYDKLTKENKQLREDLAATAIKAINVIAEMRKV